MDTTSNMGEKTRMKAKTVLLAGLLGFAGLWTAQACSLAYHTGSLDGSPRMLTGRTLDLDENSLALLTYQLEIFPRGISRDGNNFNGTIANPANWTSKYGTLVVDGIGGINEKGLSVDCLLLAESVYESASGSTPCVASSKMLYYLLDNAATVSEALSLLDAVLVLSDKKGDIQVTLHYAIRDASDDRAVIEFVNGGTKKKPVSERAILHGSDYNVMTNDPPMAKQLKYYKKFASGKRGLGGDFNALDRFVRLKMFEKTLPDAKSEWLGVCGIFQLMDTVHTVAGSVDYSRKETDIQNGKKVPAKMWANVWTTVADHGKTILYLQTEETPNIIWVDLSKLDFSTLATYGYLNWKNFPNLVGEINDNFVWIVPTDPKSRGMGAYIH